MATFYFFFFFIVLLSRTTRLASQWRHKYPYVGRVGATRGERHARSVDGELRMRDADSEVIYIPITLTSKREHENLHITWKLG